MSGYATINGASKELTAGFATIGGAWKKLSKGWVTKDGVWKQILSSRLPLSSLPEGSLVAINESGSPVLFYLAKHDYESGLNGAGRTLFVRKDCYDTRIWRSSTFPMVYEDSNIDSWLNGDYIALLDSNIQNAIATTNFYTIKSGGTVATINRSAFLLSATELGQTSSNIVVEGEAITTASKIIIANLNGVATKYWTRSPWALSSFSSKAVYITESGAIGNLKISNECGSRPCFTLPSDLTVNSQPNADGSYTLTI